MGAQIQTGALQAERLVCSRASFGLEGIVREVFDGGTGPELELALTMCALGVISGEV